VNLASIIEGHPDDAVALISRNRPTPYGKLRQQVGSLRAALAAQGVGAGDRVGLLFGNERYFVVSYLAVVGLGAIAVPLNPTSPSTEIAQELATVGATAVLVGPMAREAWRGVERASVPTVRVVMATDGHEMEGALTLDDYLGGEPLGLTEVDPGTVAALLFTSGTAGSPKAAMLTHGNLLANIEQSRLSRGALTRDDVVFGVLPLFHIFGLNVVLGLTLAAGGTVVLVQRFDPSTALDSIRDRGVTVIPGAPPMWVAWTQFLEADPAAFAHVRLALTGAAKMPEEVARTFEARFGLPLDIADTGYGHGSGEVAAVRVASAELLTGYNDAVIEQTTRYVRGLADADLDRIVDRRWDPPVTLGVRLVSVISDDLQHAGQAAYVRGLGDLR
jgi:long-chain acyl-CoA synthetase